MSKYQEEVITEVKDVSAYPGLMEVHCESGAKYATFDIAYKGKVGLQCLIEYTEHKTKGRNGKEFVNKRIVPANARPNKPSKKEASEDSILETEKQIYDIWVGVKYIVQELKKQKTNNPDKVEKDIDLPF